MVDRADRGEEALDRLAAPRHRRPHAPAHVHRHHQLALRVGADEVSDLLLPAVLEDAEGVAAEALDEPPLLVADRGRHLDDLDVHDGREARGLGPHAVHETRAVREHRHRADAVGDDVRPRVPGALPGRRLARADGVAVRREQRAAAPAGPRARSAPAADEAAHVAARRRLLDRQRGPGRRGAPRRRGRATGARRAPGPVPSPCPPGRRRRLQGPAPHERRHRVVESVATLRAHPRVEAQPVVGRHRSGLVEEVRQERRHDPGVEERRQPPLGRGGPPREAPGPRSPPRAPAAAGARTSRRAGPGPACAGRGPRRDRRRRPTRRTAARRELRGGGAPRARRSSPGRPVRGRAATRRPAPARDRGRPRGTPPPRPRLSRAGPPRGNDRSRSRRRSHRGRRRSGRGG